MPQAADFLGREGIDFGGPLMAAQQAGDGLGHDVVQQNRSGVKASMPPVAFNGDLPGIEKAFRR